jgi:endonuclease V-like protein UPF0215 family
MHLPKKGLRALGIAESYSGRVHSTLSGVVMRKDLQVDGCAFAVAMVGGMDATRVVLDIFSDLKRKDINVIMLSGCVIAWFNVMNPETIADVTQTPVICVTYEDSGGLEPDIAAHFPGDESRLDAYRQLGERLPVMLHTGQEIFIRSWDISHREAAQLCNDFTLTGGVPEPLRVARLCARAAHALHFEV